jgi:pSer/pThr/pTyr-binding forkhead associated (FHA) protein
VLAKVAVEIASVRTVVMAHRTRLAEQILTMLQGFDDLLVVVPRGKGTRATLAIGRTRDSDLVVHEPSVSQRHARLRWEAARGECFLKDVGSTNGTYVNTRPIYTEEVQLMDGDTVCFGDAQFMFLLIETLHAQLAASGGRSAAELVR